MTLRILLGAAAVAAVCEGRGHHAELPERPRKTAVLVMRHCIRSTTEDGVYGTPGFDFYNNYSARPWPPFEGVRPDDCLPRGLDIVEAQGRWLAANGWLPPPLRLVADDSFRDLQTGRALLSGLGLPVDNGTFRVDAGPFAAAGTCPLPSKKEQVAAVEGQLLRFPVQETLFAEMHAELYDILGRGAAGNWTTTPCKVDAESAFPDGSCAAASNFVERLFMNWGGGLELGWGRLTSKRLAELLHLHSWYRTVANSVPELVAFSQASIAHIVLEELEAGEPGTRVYAGHDTQLNALGASLGLTWRPSPFPTNSTMPSSGLLFERENGTVRASYIFVANFSDSSGEMVSVPAELAGDPEGTASLSVFRALVMQGSVAACANPAPRWPPASPVDRSPLYT